MLITYIILSVFCILLGIGLLFIKSLPLSKSLVQNDLKTMIANERQGRDGEVSYTLKRYILIGLGIFLLLLGLGIAHSAYILFTIR